MTSRYIPVKVRRDLHERSRGLCECCGSAGSLERHHLIEHHIGGPNTLENLIHLCPSCHAQLPKILDQDQQRRIQEWHHKDGAGQNRAANASLSTIIPVMTIGTTLFMNARYVWTIDEQQAVSLIPDDSGLCANVVFLNELLSLNILVLGNRMIWQGNCNVSKFESDLIRIESGSDWFEISAQPILTLRGSLHFNGMPIVFTETEGLSFPGFSGAGTRIECSDSHRSAISMNKDGRFMLTP